MFVLNNVTLYLIVIVLNLLCYDVSCHHSRKGNWKNIMYKDISMKKYELHSMVKLILCGWKLLPRNTHILFNYHLFAYIKCVKPTFTETLLSYNGEISGVL